MRFYIDVNDLIISHGEQELRFAFKYYLKGNTRVSDKVFTQINKYLGDLPAKKQKGIFKVYNRIYDIFYINPNELRYAEEEISEAVKQLQSAVADMYLLIDYNNLRHWCLNNKEFYMQPNLKNDYQTYRPETTYLLDDYKGLLFFSTLLKLMTPIWGTFIVNYNKSIGKDYKESIALLLLAKTGIAAMPEYEKLELLVKSISDKTVVTINAVFGNLGTIDLPDWALATVIVRKLCLAEVDNETVKLINIIYSHLTNALWAGSLEDRGETVRIRERKTPEEDGNGDEENRASVLEKLRLRQTRPDHVVLIDSVYLNEIKKIIKDIDPSLPITKEPYAKCIKNFKRLRQSLLSLKICDFHVQICACVIKSGSSKRKIISPFNLENASFEDMIKLVFISQLLLHYWGFTNIANLLTANTVEVPNDMIRDNFMTLPVKLQEEIAAMYPYYRNSNKTVALNRRPLIVNYGTMFINSTAEFINQNDWYYSNTYLSEDKMNISGTLINIPADIKIELGKMLLKTIGNKKDVII